MTVGSLELSANKDIEQVIEIVDDFGKYRVLAKHLQVRQLPLDFYVLASIDISHVCVSEYDASRFNAKF